MIFGWINSKVHFRFNLLPFMQVREFVVDLLLLLFHDVDSLKICLFFSPLNNVHCPLLGLCLDGLFHLFDSFLDFPYDHIFKFVVLIISTNLWFSQFLYSVIIDLSRDIKAIHFFSLNLSSSHKPSLQDLSQIWDGLWFCCFAKILPIFSNLSCPRIFCFSKG